MCSVPGKKSDLWWWWWFDSGAAQVKQRDCRTCRVELGWAGQGGPWSLADALQKRRRTVTGKLEQPSRAPRTENTEHRQDEWWSSLGLAQLALYHRQTSTHHLSTLSVSLYQSQQRTKYLRSLIYKGDRSMFVLLGM